MRLLAHSYGCLSSLPILHHGRWSAIDVCRGMSANRLGWFGGNKMRTSPRHEWCASSSDVHTQRWMGIQVRTVKHTHGRLGAKNVVLETKALQESHVLYLVSVYDLAQLRTKRLTFYSPHYYTTPLYIIIPRIFPLELTFRVELMLMIGLELRSGLSYILTTASKRSQRLHSPPRHG